MLLGRAVIFCVCRAVWFSTVLTGHRLSTILPLTELAGPFKLLLSVVTCPYHKLTRELGLIRGQKQHLHTIQLTPLQGRDKAAKSLLCSMRPHRRQPTSLPRP